MRILFVNDYDSDIGGVEIYDKQLISLLRERGHEVRFVGGRRPENYYFQFLRSFYSPTYRDLILAEVSAFDPDVIFAHSICYNVSPSFLRPVSKRNVPIVLTVPELAQLSYTFPNVPFYFVPASFTRKAVQRRFIERFVDEIIAPSNVAADQIREDLDTAAVNCIRHPTFWEVASEPPNLDGQRVLYVGRLDQNKGVDVLIRAMENVLVEFESATLEIVGDGPEMDRLRALVADRGLDSSVTFMGRVPHEEIKQKYVESSIFVLPSVIEENCPVTINEAMSQGLPVVTTDIGGQRELVEGGDCALLAAPNDPDALADRLKHLLADADERNRLSENGRRHAEQFSIDKHLEDVEAVLVNAIEESRSRG